MLNLETDRQWDFRMLFPEHHESSLAVPMGGEATHGTPEGSSFRFMHMSAFGTGATGATFPNEARCDTRLFGLVSEVLLNPPGLHQRNLLAGFTTKALLLFGILFDTSRVADYQLANSVKEAPVNCLSGGFMEQVSDLVVSLALEASLGPDQFLPTTAPLGTARKRPDLNTYLLIVSERCRPFEFITDDGVADRQDYDIEGEKDAYYRVRRVCKAADSFEIGFDKAHYVALLEVLLK